MNSFNLTLSGKVFICPSILNESFAGQSHLGWRSLLFRTLNTSCQSLLICKVSVEKSSNGLMGTPLQVTNFLSLVAFKILSLSLTFGILIMIILGVGLFGSNLYGTLCASCTYMSISFCLVPKLGNFSVIILSNRFPISCSFSSPSGTHMM